MTLKSTWKRSNRNIFCLNNKHYQDHIWLQSNKNHPQWFKSIGYYWYHITKVYLPLKRKDENMLTKAFASGSPDSYFFKKKKKNPHFYLQLVHFFFNLFIIFFCLFRALPMVYGGSQTRGLIGATAAGLHQSHSNARSNPHLWPTPQLTATPDP